MSVPPFDRTNSYSSPSPSEDDDNVQEQSTTTSKQFQLPNRNNPNERKSDAGKNNSQKNSDSDNVFNISKTPVKKGDLKKEDTPASAKKKNAENENALISSVTGKSEKEEKDQKEKEDQMFNVSGGDLLSKIEMTGTISITSTDAIEKKDLSKVVELVQKMVAQLSSGTAGGQTVTSLQLKGIDVPDAFANSSIELTQTSEGALNIQFTNFATPQQEAQAIAMVEKDKAALTQLATALQAKNLSIAGIQVGTHVINLPRADTPLIFQAPASSEGQQAQRERDQSQDQSQDQGRRRDQDEQEDQES